jgi:hypothetical protein
MHPPLMRELLYDCLSLTSMYRNCMHALDLMIIIADVLYMYSWIAQCHDADHSRGRVLHFGLLESVEGSKVSFALSAL